MLLKTILLGSIDQKSYYAVNLSADFYSSLNLIINPSDKP